MPRMTQAQIRHLRTKVELKIGEARRAHPAQKKIRDIDEQVRAISGDALKLTVAALPDKKLKELVIKRFTKVAPGAHWNSHSLESSLTKTREYRTLVTRPLDQLGKKKTMLNEELNAALCELRKAGETLIDQAIFAGSSDEVLDLIDAFMAR